MESNKSKREEIQTRSVSKAERSSENRLSNGVELNMQNNPGSDVRISDETLANQLDLEDRYGIDPDTNYIEGAQVRHPNRQADATSAKVRMGRLSSGRRAGKNGVQGSNGMSARPDRLDLTKEALIELANFTSRVCVTIYMPAHEDTSVPNSVNVDTILFKTLLQQCEKMRDGEDAVLLKSCLQPAYDLVHNVDFWREQKGGGYAFFIAEGFFRYTTLRVAPETQTLVNDSFLIQQLLPYTLDQQYFYLLVISKKQSKLFRGDRFALTPVSIPEMPNGIEDVVHLEQKDDQNLFRTGSSGGGGGAVYHGTGSSRPDDKENIAMYLAEVDSTLRQSALRDETAPLLLAGVGYIIPIYRKVTRYNNVWDTALTGSREFENETTLHAEAADAMRSYFDEPKKLALADYGNKSASGLTSFILDDIIRAAHYKRIETLFVDKKARLSGSFDETTDRLTVHASDNDHDDDLVHKTILKTVMFGGKVFILDQEEMPARRMMAAVMRYGL